MDQKKSDKIAGLFCLGFFGFVFMLIGFGLEVIPLGVIGLFLFFATCFGCVGATVNSSQSTSTPSRSTNYPNKYPVPPQQRPISAATRISEPTNSKVSGECPHCESYRKKNYRYCGICGKDLNLKTPIPATKSTISSNIPGSNKSNFKSHSITIEPSSSISNSSPLVVKQSAKNSSTESSSAPSIRTIPSPISNPVENSADISSMMVDLFNDSKESLGISKIENFIQDSSVPSKIIPIDEKIPKIHIKKRDRTPDRSRDKPPTHPQDKSIHQTTSINSVKILQKVETNQENLGKRNILGPTLNSFGSPHYFYSKQSNRK